MLQSLTCQHGYPQLVDASLAPVVPCRLTSKAWTYSKHSCF
ncbi:hypothetical protein HMPREF0281_01780 [Corynebacterium ammoniagenes DSM 20306]|uniref:Uncharacterized protein n=1 Tax=Corynebacterium ammoniagenes DSM 20306 TaxID=649754 RepID=A0ABP2IBZ2_CORAM|nr:hypothetical protein HMPREF0281_01780 [Corynebacterium ammoniagenes DSM 20306]